MYIDISKDIKLLVYFLFYSKITSHQYIWYQLMELQGAGHNSVTTLLLI